VASGQRTLLSVQAREERGSRASRRLRRAGLVPGVVYGIEADSVAFKVDARRVRAVLAEGHALFDVEVEGDGDGRQPVIVKDQQRDPVRGSLKHLDLLRVRLDEKIQATVPLEIEGVEDAPGVREGGVLEHVTRELLIEALPTDIPDRIVADVSGMGIAETMMLDAITAPAGVDFVGDNLEEMVVATVTAPSEVVEEEEIEEEAELVGEEGEVPEGEEGAAPEGEGEGGEAAESGGEES
jgi:large subunit ribosomal protein L25